ncbi:hypothetical protein KM800_06230 [Clostridium tyrobutyricum]|uniref:hypothetical protein n=1 Tax=Clostridium tyrobutyricum TaxID=1519 RepID=UPI001C3950E2|nr:hypothetical protein [Clostridium tyrobutyricum]MBV4418933.1 hypothetical protein [Clostridium tyrobutyricum]
MKYISLILFLIGFLMILLSLILILIKTAKCRKIGILPVSAVIVGIIVLGSGVEYDKMQKIVLSKIPSKLKTSVSNNNNKTEISKNKPFDANGSVVPKVSTLNSLGDKMTIDADGSKTINDNIRFSPNNIRHFIDNDGAKVDVPDGKKYTDGIHYTEYTFTKDDSAFDYSIYVSNENLSTNNYNDPGDYKEDASSGKLEDHSGDKSYEAMSYLDFIRRFVPVKTPKNTISGDFLIGNWVGAEQQILNSQMTIDMNINDGQTLDLHCKYIPNIDSTYGYKVEELGKNAYKLYLYNMTVRADSNNGGGAVFSDEPINTTFILYMKNKNSFDAVFTNNEDKRVSVNMTRS